jgi:hypothetical protein
MLEHVAADDIVELQAAQTFRTVEMPGRITGAFDPVTAISKQSP